MNDGEEQQMIGIDTQAPIVVQSLETNIEKEAIKNKDRSEIMSLINQDNNEGTSISTMNLPDIWSPISPSKKLIYEIQIATDLHIDRKGQNPHIIPTGEYLLLCGDIASTRMSREEVEKYLKGLSTNFHKVIWIFGNHEFFGRGENTMDDLLEQGRELAKRTGTILLHNETYDISPWLRVIGTPLFLHIKDDNDKRFARLRCTDSKLFTVYDKTIHSMRPITAKEFNALGDQSIQFLLSEVQRCVNDGVYCIIMTHYGGPFPRTTNLEERKKRYESDLRAPGLFMEPSRLEEVLKVGKENIILWTYGHTHERVRSYCSIDGYKIPIINNPLGFPSEKQCQAHFKRDFVVPISLGDK